MGCDGYMNIQHAPKKIVVRCYICNQIIDLEVDNPFLEHKNCAIDGQLKVCLEIDGYKER